MSDLYNLANISGSGKKMQVQVKTRFFIYNKELKNQMQKYQRLSWVSGKQNVSGKTETRLEVQSKVNTLEDTKITSVSSGVTCESVYLTVT